MSDARIHGPASPVPPAPPATAPAAAREASATWAPDRLAIARRPAPATHFSWRRAFGHFGHGLWAEAKQMVLAPFQHPLATLAVLGASTAVLLAAPIVGISAAAIGNLMLVGFGAAALWRMGRGAAGAIADYRRHDYARAEGDFEAIGAGGADLLATVGPGMVGKGYAVLKRTEAGQAVSRVVAGSKAGQALSAARTRAFGFVRTSIFGRLKAAPGQSTKLGALGDAARKVDAALPGSQRLNFTAARLNQWRLAIARSGTVRGFNRLFDTLPAEWADQLEGRAITFVNYTKPAQALRDWGLARAAAQQGQSVEALKAAIAARLAIPKVLERATDVSPTLVRGPVPTTSEDFAYLVKQKNVRTVVSLLHPDNPDEVALLARERQLAAQAGVKLVNLPLPFGVDPPQEMVDRFLATVDAANPGARVYLHCRLGRDRTGTMVSIFREARQGVSGEDALAEMERFGYDPQKDTYLAYLGKFVLNYMKRGALDAKKLFLSGNAQDAARAVRGTAAATLPVASRRGERTG